VEASPYYGMADRTAWIHPAVRTSTSPSAGRKFLLPPI
jgi:hypothetical protein